MTIFFIILSSLNFHKLLTEGGYRGGKVYVVEGTLEALVRLVRDGLVSVQDAAASAGVDADEIRRTLAAEG